VIRNPDTLLSFSNSSQCEQRENLTATLPQVLAVPLFSSCFHRERQQHNTERCNATALYGFCKLTLRQEQSGTSHSSKLCETDEES